MNIDKIKPYEKNAKKHPEKQIKQIVNSIKEFGFNQPIVVDKKGVIIVGHGRYEAAKRLNLTEVPVLEVNLTQEQANAYRLADNKLNESDWDMGLAIEELKGLSDEMFELTGFDKDLIFDVKEDEFDAEAEYAKITQPKANLGELWQLGEHRLLCGDSTKEESYIRLMDGKKADMIFTDPPYNVGYDYTITYVKGRTRKDKFKAFDDSKSDIDFKEFIKDVFLRCKECLQDYAPFYCWHASKTDYLFRQGIIEAGYKISLTIYWLKNGCTFSKGLDYLWAIEPCFYGWQEGKKHYVNKKLGGSFKNIIDLDINDFEQLPNLWYENRDKIKDYGHPTQKPTRLAERALKKSSKTNQIILEPFNGSGSTMMACEQLNRKCYAIELDPKFVDVAIKRWEDYTGQKAKKVVK